MKRNKLLPGLILISGLTLIFLSGCTAGTTTSAPSTTIAAKTAISTTTTAAATTNMGKTPTAAASPIFELKEIHPGIYTDPNGTDPPRKQFFFTYPTNQSTMLIKFISPDGYFREPFWIKGPGEMKDRANIPPQDLDDTRENRFLADSVGCVALTGTYKMVAYNAMREMFWSKEITYKGAKLLIEEAKINKWSWTWSYPVCEFFMKEISVTVSNKGDLPSFASVSLSVDNKRVGVVGLGYVDAGATRTFNFPSPYYMIVINYKNPGDTIPTSSHGFSVNLVSRVPRSSEDKETWYGPAPSTLSAYYNSQECPYKILSGMPGYLVLYEYSTTVQTPQVETRN